MERAPDEAEARGLGPAARGARALAAAWAAARGERPGRRAPALEPDFAPRLRPLPECLAADGALDPRCMDALFGFEFRAPAEAGPEPGPALALPARGATLRCEAGSWAPAGAGRWRALLPGPLCLHDLAGEPLRVLPHGASEVALVGADFRAGAPPQPPVRFDDLGRALLLRCIYGVLLVDAAPAPAPAPGPAPAPTV